MNELPPDEGMEPEEFHKMITRHAEHIGEHALGVVIAVIRNEKDGESGFYYELEGNGYVAEKAAEEVVYTLRANKINHR